MNCLDFRRDALAQPLRLEPAAAEHAAACPGCKAFLERQRELDAELYDVMRVPVPDGLADRVLVAQGIRRRRRPWLWALAASLMLALGIGIAGRPFFSGRALAGEALAHVAEEPQSFTISHRHAPGMLAGELAAQGVRLASALGEVTYAQLCPMAAGKARHIVVTTAQGPVTLFLLPNDAARRGRAEVDSEGMTAIVLPASRGSIAIVAASAEQARAVERSLSFT
jgi:hypothetical protein